MRNSRRNLVLVATSALALSTFAASPALADDGHEHGHEQGHGNLLKAELVGSSPAPASPVIAGIAPGGKQWMNSESTVRVRADGRIKVRIRALVIPGNVPANPVPSVVATLVCGSTAPAAGASTAPFALDLAGNGRTKDMVAVPMPCTDPTVLIQPAAIRGVYIASTVMDDDQDDD